MSNLYKYITIHANLTIIFKQIEINIKYIYMTFKQFVKICEECWKQKYEFVFISKNNDIDKGRYRKGFDSFINL